MTVDDALVVADAQPPADKCDYYADPELIEAAVALAVEVRRLQEVEKRVEALMERPDGHDALHQDGSIPYVLLLSLRKALNPSEPKP